MISIFIQWILGLNVAVPQVFFSITFKMLMSALTSLCLTLTLAKVFIAKLVSMKVGHKVRVSDCKTLAASYDKRESIPSMGGVLFICTIFLSCMLWMDVFHPFTFLLLLTLSVLGGIGFLDDYYKIQNNSGFSAKAKFLLQFTLFFFIASYLHVQSISDFVNNFMGFTPIEIKGLSHSGSTSSAMHLMFIPFFKNPIVIGSTLFMMFFSIFVLTGVSNAVNLTDGLDGLATGCTILVACVFAIIAFISNHINIASYLNILYIDGASQIAIFLSALIGALLGFLWFNSYPAQVFMGDTGSISLGGAIALVAILLRREFLLALVGGVFVAETLSVILQVFSFQVFGKRIFKCSPLHHHFEIKGWHESKIVIRFWMIGLILALIGLVSLKMQ